MTTKPHIKYPSIDNTKNALKELQRRFEFKGERVPSLELEGTVKIHGTNGAIVYWDDDEVTVQSRNRIITVNNDNAGFATYVSEFGAENIYQPNDWSDGMVAHVVFGEFCGGNIQKGVGVSGMAKQFIPFEVGYVFYDCGEYNLELVDLNLAMGTFGEHVKTIDHFGRYYINIDNPYDIDTIMSQLDEFTNEVEQNCPVAAELNPDSTNTIGEGVVWNVYAIDGISPVYKLKHKGEKHKGEKHKRKPRVTARSIEKSSNPLIEQFMVDAVSDDRLMQGIEYVKETDPTLSMKSIGRYFKWVSEDIRREHRFDIEELEKQDIKWNNLAKFVTKRAKEFYLIMDEVYNG